MRLYSIMAAVATSLATMQAAADCTWEWLCNGEGQCKQMPICDSVLETPPPRPRARSRPAVPPLAMRPTRSPARRGQQPTLTCEHIMRKGKTGRWYWHEACFCTDPRRPATDAAVREHRARATTQ
jgi:hypothetical protein